jgi:hypothetical protein
MVVDLTLSCHPVHIVLSCCETILDLILTMSVVQIRFETDAPGLKLLQDKLYVGSGRFVIEEDRPVIVEYKISEVSAQCNKGSKND